MLTELISRVLNEYQQAKSEPMAKHPFAPILRNSIPDALSALLMLGPRYTIKGSPGLANWTHVPWIALMDDLVTDSPERGYYPTMLFREDMSGFYLSLNQGITNIRKLYKSGAAEVLRVRAQDYVARVGKAPYGFEIGRIELLAPKGSAPSYYDYGSIFAKFYPRDLLPTDQQLITDYRTILGVYSHLVEFDDSETQDDEDLSKSAELDRFEDVRRWRYHKRIERNRSLVKQVKQERGYKCEACEFDFSKFYGNIGEQFIEAHHLTPISKLEGKVLLDPRTDFRVLCANCHRMIHKLEDVSSLESLRSRIRNYKQETE